MSDIATERRWYTVAVTKNPENARGRVRDLLGDGREFYDCIGADTRDDDPRFPVGADCLYAVELTAAEAAELAQRGESTGPGNNVRAVEISALGDPHTAPTPIPGESTLRYLRADASSIDTTVWHGRDATVAVLDQGTTQAVRDRMGWTLVGRTNTGDPVPAGQELHAATDGRASGFWDHGCLVAPNAVPAGGRLLDALIVSSDGRAPVAALAAAVRWACDQGAKIINISFGFSVGSQAFVDALNYARTAGVEVFASAGNDGQNSLAFPAAYSRDPSFPNVHSVVAFDEATNARALFGVGTASPGSNYAVDATGCAPGRNVASLTPTAEVTAWQGTSCASPCAASDAARGCTGGRFTPRQVGAALKANLRDTGQLALYQGGGAYDLRRALVALGATSAPGPRRNPSTNPSLEGGVAGHPAGAGDGTWVTPTAHATGGRTGPAWASYTATAATVWFYGPSQPVTPGAVLCPAVFARRSSASDPNGTGTKYSRCYLAFYNASGGFISYSAPVAVHSPGADVWHRLSHDRAVAPAGSASLRPFVYANDATVGEVFGVDGWLPEPSENVEPYFDGSSSGAVWAGMPQASPSTLKSTSAPPRPGALLLGA